MRRTTFLIAALALGASQAAAQNNVVDVNAVTVNNEVAADPNVAAPMPVDEANAAVPIEPAPPVDDEGTVPTREDRGFPWGLIGLVGLVGLLGRARR